MLEKILDEIDWSLLMSSFSGAMTFILIQKEFHGKSKIAAFIVSFMMGVLGAGSTVDFVNHYFPEHPEISLDAGAFVCSSLVISVFMLAISKLESFVNSRKTFKETRR